MITPIATPSGAHVYAADNASRAELLAASREQLLAAGVHRLEADEMLADRPGMVVPAHWAGDEVGFCGPEHPDALAVTVVNIPQMEHVATRRSLA